MFHSTPFFLYMILFFKVTNRVFFNENVKKSLLSERRPCRLKINSGQLEVDCFHLLYPLGRGNSPADHCNLERWKTILATHCGWRFSNALQCVAMEMAAFKGLLLADE